MSKLRLCLPNRVKIGLPAKDGDAGKVTASLAAYAVKSDE